LRKRKSAEEEEDNEAQQCLHSFTVVDLTVATNNIKQLNVSMETEELVPVALF
jgi:hypothetical protein